jgi:undecaprenyl diphosphate synthase
MHVAIIMDGNGRWAEKRGLKRSVGHRAGARAVSRAVETAARRGVDVLTLYAFSSDNWARPADEVAQLMALLRRHLRSEVGRCLENGIRVNVIGRRDRLDSALLAEIEHVERCTSGGQRMLLRIAIDYSAREAIVRAAGLPRAADQPHSCVDFGDALDRATNAVQPTPDVDLLIRTGGERRLSDFLLFELAYAELLFLDLAWPDFDEPAFTQALTDFARRERRFGRVAVDRIGQVASAQPA